MVIHVVFMNHAKVSPPDELWRAPRAVSCGRPTAGCAPLRALASGFYEDCKRDVELSLTFLHFDILH